MGNARSFLVVDSNVAFATMLKESLEQQEGCFARVAANGEQALAALDGAEFDLAIVDLGVTDPDGVELVHQLRQQEPDLHLMLIPLNGAQVPADLGDVSIQGVLTKPFFLPDLPAQIADALARPVGGAEGGPALQPHGEEDRESEVPAEPERPERASPQPVAPRRPRGTVYVALDEDNPAVMEELDRLVRDVNADGVILTDGVDLAAHTGTLSEEAMRGLARTVAESYRTAARVAQVLGKKEGGRFEQSMGGGDHLVYSLAVFEDIVLSVALCSKARLGMIRHRTREVADALRALMDAG